MVNKIVYFSKVSAVKCRKQCHTSQIHIQLFGLAPGTRLGLGFYLSHKLCRRSWILAHTGSGWAASGSTRYQTNCLMARSEWRTSQERRFQAPGWRQDSVMMAVADYHPMAGVTEFYGFFFECIGTLICHNRYIEVVYLTLLLIRQHYLSTNIFTFLLITGNIDITFHINAR